MRFFSIILISCLGFIVYSNTFHCPFHFDDYIYIIDNHAIKNIQDLLSIWAFYPFRFITFLSFALNYHFHQLDVFGYHVVNLCVHVISAILVWWLTLLTLSTPEMKKEKITDFHAKLIALLAGLVFVSHPVQTEAVTYVWQRTASMAAMFYLASVCFYVKARLCTVESHAKRVQKNFGGFYYTCSLILAVVAMFTKEMTATLPLIVFFYEFSFFRTEKIFNWKYSIPFLAIFLMLSLIVVLLPSTIKDKEMEGVLSGIQSISPLHYFWTQLRVIVTYIRLVFVPIHQNLDYDYPTFNSLFKLPVLASFSLIIAILFWAKHLFSKYRLISFSIFWFFLTLLPESSVIPLKDVIFEHRLYLPLVGYSLFLVSAVYYGFGFLRSFTSFRMTIIVPIMTIIVPIMTIIVLTMIIACNSVLTYQRNKVWREDLTLWADTVQKSPHKARPLNNLGKAYMDKSEYTRAMSYFNKAIEADPTYTEAYINRGNVYTQQDNYSQALAEYNKAIELNGFAEAYNNRSFVDGKLGLLVQGIFDCNKALEINPYYSEAYNNCGLIHDGQGNLAQAISDYDKAIELNPGYSIAFYNRGLSYEKQGDDSEAISDYDQAIEIDPKYADSYNNRGFIFEKQDNLIQAMSDYNKSIELDPKNADAYNNRGNIENKQGDYTQAVVDYGKAIEFNPAYAGAYYNRGSILGKHGRLTDAIVDLTKAIELQPNYPEAFDNRAVAYFILKDYKNAWADAQKAEVLGAAVNPGFINALKRALGQDN